MSVRVFRAFLLIGLLIVIGLVASAQAETVCGKSPAVGVAYRVTGVHLQLQMTVQFQDSYGDHQYATLTANWRTHHQPPVSESNYALFNGCRGRGATVRKFTDWASAIGARPLLTMNASWYDSGTDAGTSPFSGSCSASFIDEVGVDSAMNRDVVTHSGVVTIGRHPKQAISGYVNTWPTGDCSPDNTEVAADAIQGGLDDSRMAPIRLPLAQLWRTARSIRIPVGASWTGHVGPWGLKDQDPGAVATVSMTWQGMLTFARAYTCKPNGCGLPNQY